jgi:hypothetical protein
MRSEFEVKEVFEQAGTFDGQFVLSINPDLLMRIVNDMAAQDDCDLEDMKNPKRLAVQIVIKTRELEMPPSETP